MHKIASFENIPTQLIGLDQWVCWRYVKGRNGDMGKMPCMPCGRPASVVSPKCWSTFEDVLYAYRNRRFDGIGFCFREENKLVGIDLDSCYSFDSLEPWAEDIVQSIGSYTEISPSGTGVKIIASIATPWCSKNRGVVRAWPVAKKKPGIEVYTRARYFCLTGDRYHHFATIAAADPELQWIQNWYFPKPKSESRPTVNSAGYQVNSKLMEYRSDTSPDRSKLMHRAAQYLSRLPPSISGAKGHNALFYAACVLVQGFALSDDDAFEILADHYNPRCKPPWTPWELLHKIESARRRPHYPGYLIKRVASE